MESVYDPDMGYWTYEYDDNGNLKVQQDAKGNTIEFIYDPINRLTQKAVVPAGVVPERDVDGEIIPWQEGIKTVVYTYDDPIVANSTGRLTRVDYDGGSISFEYDELGRETATTKTINGTPYTVNRTYDAMDRLKTLTYPDNEELTYTYDASGAIKSIVGLTKTYVSDIKYNAQGQMTQITYGNGVVTTYDYDPYT